MELQGKIIQVGLVTSGKAEKSGNTWHKQEAVLEVPGKYPKRMAFTIFGEDRIKQFNLFAGMECIVQFDIDAHEYQGRWFNSINAYNVKNTGIFSKEPSPATPSNRVSAGSPSGYQPPLPEQSDDLPF